MKSLLIPVHSFVDVITNSSSEVFVSADEKTVEAVKDLIDNLLIGVGSDKRCDDLFDVVVSIEVKNPKPYKERVSGEPWQWRVSVPVDSELGKEAFAERERRFDNGDGHGCNTGVLVTPKPGTNENIVLAAKTLSDLTNLFSLDAYYN